MTERTRAMAPTPECKPPLPFLSSTKATTETSLPHPHPLPLPLLNNKGKRVDGRDRDQLRQIFMKTGVIHAATGSAYLELNNTKLICGVYGPKGSSKVQEYSESGTLFCDFKFASFSCPDARIGFASSGAEKELSLQVQQALASAVRLDRFPKSSVDIIVLVLQHDGAVLSAAITCASMALADAGIEMYDLVPACTAAATQPQATTEGGNTGTGTGTGTGSVVVFDPTWREEQKQEGRVVLARMPSMNQVSQLLMDGELALPLVEESIELCIDGCDKLYSMMRDVLVDSVQNNVT